MAEYLEADHVLALASGTAALHLALVALGIGPGDEVITSPITWPATANVIVHTGATPVFVDVLERDLNIDPGLVAAAVTDRTKAVLPVDLAANAESLGASVIRCRTVGMLNMVDEAGEDPEVAADDVVEDLVIAVSEIDLAHVDHYLKFLRLVCSRSKRFRWSLWPNCLWRFHHGYHDKRLLCLSRSTMEANAISITTIRKTNAVPY